MALTCKGSHKVLPFGMIMDLKAESRKQLPPVPPPLQYLCTPEPVLNEIAGDDFCDLEAKNSLFNLV